MISLTASAEDITDAVRSILRNGLIQFPELGRRVEQRLPNLASRMQVRQAAWRFVRAGQAEITTDLAIRWMESGCSSQPPEQGGRDEF